VDELISPHSYSLLCLSGLQLFARSATSMTIGREMKAGEKGGQI
jgi:hypothetical protein